MRKNTRLLITFPIYTATAAVCAIWLPVSQWKSGIDALLVFLGLIIAALIQMIPLTANFLQSEDLTPEEIRDLSLKLEKQQDLWLGILTSAVIAAILLVAIKYGVSFKPAEDSWKFVALDMLKRLVSATIGFALSITLLRFMDIISGVKSLQETKSAILYRISKRREIGKRMQKIAHRSDSLSKSRMGNVGLSESFGKLLPPDQE